jgi:transposase
MLPNSNTFGYTELRRGIDGLIAVVNAGFKLDPRKSGSIFLFYGRRCDSIKALLMRETAGFFAINDLQMESYSGHEVPVKLAL